MAREIIITLRITDEETVENYADVHPEIIWDDLSFGTLMDHCEVVGVVVQETTATASDSRPHERI